MSCDSVKNCTCCPGKNSEKQAAPYFVRAVNKLEEQCTNLNSRKEFLAKKVTNMEKAFPMVLATLLANADCDETQIGRILEMVNEMSPNQNALEKMAENLVCETKNMNEEIEGLHVGEFTTFGMKLLNI